MGLMCTLGLAACISVGGSSYTEKKLNDIIYECRTANSYQFYNEITFILVDGKYRSGRQQGYLALEVLEELGVDFRWKPSGKVPSQGFLAKYRKDQLRSACYPFLVYSGG